MSETLTPKQRYDSNKTKHYGLKCIINTESDIIAKLDSVPNKAGYIKDLIRADLARQEK